MMVRCQDDKTEDSAMTKPLYCSWRPNDRRLHRAGTEATPERPGRTQDQKARQLLVWLSAVSERGQTLQAHPKIKITTASEHNTLQFEDVLGPTNTSRDIYADKGNVNHKREEQLANVGYRMHIQRKGSKDKPLSEAQQRRNRRITSPPAPLPPQQG
jgi:hypothetical protein